MAKFGAVVEEGGPKYSEEMQQTPPTPESEEMMGRMAGNFDLFIAPEIRQIGGYVPDTSTPFGTYRRGSSQPQARPRVSKRRVGQPSCSLSAWTSL